MNSELERCIEYLEGLRKSNDLLREWGQYESEEVDRLNELLTKQINMSQKAQSELLIDLVLVHLQAGTLDKALAMKLLYEIKTATIEEFSEALNESRNV